MLYSAFGFIQEQKITLDIIKNNFPEQVIEAEIAGLKFNKTYGKAISKINFEIKQRRGDNYNSFLTNLKYQFKTSLNDKKISKKTAGSFIAHVKKRADGYIKSPISETLLKYQYQ